MESISELKIKCQSQKTNKDFLLAKGYLVHRSISIYITRFLLEFFPRIKPNQITFFLILISILGALMLLSVDFYKQLLGIFLIYFGFLLDKVDGELARYKNLITLLGGYLDELYHAIVPNFLLFGFLYSILWQEKIYTLLFLVIVMLNILNRLNRKLYLILYVKFYRLLSENKIYYSTGNNWLNKVFNCSLFKIFSLIERFDFIIFTIFLAILVNRIWQIDIRAYYLYIYFIFSLLYFIRWTLLNYFGNLEKKVKNLLENNY